MRMTKRTFVNPFASNAPVATPVAEPEPASQGGLDPGLTVDHLPLVANPPEFRELELAQIVESKTNPRRSFAAGPMQELTDSIRESGVHVPILVRPIKGDRVPQPAYELVAGARRLRASIAAGRKTIPALVQEMTDLRVLEVQFIENKQREGVHPLDEAAAIAHFKDSGIAPEVIARKVGMGLSWVKKRLQLNQLHTYFQYLWVEKGKLGVEQALVIARLSPGQQKILRDECKKLSWMIDHLHDTRWLKEKIGDTFERELSSVAWKLDDVELLPAAGACNVCLKRSSANAALFDDVKADTCLDPECFDKKRDALVQLQIKVTTEKASKPPILVTSEYSNKKREDGAVERYAVPEIKPAEAKKLPPEQVRSVVIIDGEDAGKTFLTRVDPKAKPSRPTISDAERKRKEKAKQEEAFNAYLLDYIMENGACGNLAGQRVATLKLFERLWDDSRAKICSRRGWEKPKNAGYSDWRLKAAAKFINDANEVQVARFAIECACIGYLKVDGAYGDNEGSKKLRAIAAELDVNVDAARQSFDRGEPVTDQKPSKFKKKGK